MCVLGGYGRAGIRGLCQPWFCSPLLKSVCMCACPCPQHVCGCWRTVSRSGFSRTNTWVLRITLALRPGNRCHYPLSPPAGRPLLELGLLPERGWLVCSLAMLLSFPSPRPVSVGITDLEPTTAQLFMCQGWSQAPY